MKLRFEVPRGARISDDLGAIIRNVPQTTLWQRESLQRGELEIERIGDEIHWHAADETLVFPLSIISALGFDSFPYLDVRLASVWFTFQFPDGQLSVVGEPQITYRMITGSEIHSEWLRKVVSDISQLFSLTASEEHYY